MVVTVQQQNYTCLLMFSISYLLIHTRVRHIFLIHTRVRHIFLIHTRIRHILLSHTRIRHILLSHTRIRHILLSHTSIRHILVQCLLHVLRKQHFCQVPRYSQTVPIFIENITIYYSLYIMAHT